MSQTEARNWNLLLISALRNILSLKFIDNGKSTMFVNFYLQNSYGISIGFLKMSWSTFHGGNNKSSLIKFGVYLDLQKYSPKTAKVTLSLIGHWHVGIPRSPNFVKQLDLVQKQKLEFTPWWRAYKKLDSVWRSFDHRKRVSVTTVKVLTLLFWHTFIF